MNKLFTRNNFFISDLQKQMFLRAFIISFAAIFTQTLAVIVDNFIVLGYYGEAEIASVSLANPFFYMLEIPAVGFASGLQTVCSKALGAGQIERVNRIFNQVMQFSAILLVVLTIISYLTVPQMAYVFGARHRTAELLGYTSQYLYGLIFEIVPYVLFCIMTPIIILDNGGRIIMIASVCGCIVDIILDIVSVNYGWGLLGIGLATSASAYVYLFVTLLHFLRKDRVIHLKLTPFDRSDIRETCERGVPKALYSLADTIRSAIIVALISATSGVVGAAVLTVHTTLSYVLTIFATGLAGAVSILAGICCGEKNGEELEGVGILAHRYCLLFSAVTIILLTAAGKPFAEMLMKSDESVALLLFAMVCLMLEMPLATLVRLRNSYMQAIGQAKAAQWVGVASHVFILLICAGILALPFGVRGVFISFPIAYLIVLIRVWYSHVKRTGKTLPAGADYLEVDDSFFAKPGDVISYPVESIEDCVLASEQVTLFCKGHKLDARKSFLAGLCTEELTTIMMGNQLSVQPKPEAADIRIVIDGKDVIVRLRNVGNAFSLKNFADRIEEDDNTPDIAGVRIILKSTKDFSYYRSYGMNTTIIKV